MDICVYIYFVLSLLLVPTNGHTEPACGACAPKFEYEFKVLQKLIDLENRQNTLEAEINRQNDQIISQKNVIEDLTSTKTRTDKQSNGATYVRWGRTTCPGNGTEFIYKGTMAGNKWNEYGGGANQLCLPDDPAWGGYIDGYNSGATIHGTEIEIDASVSAKLFGKQATNQDIPCAVCSSVRTSHMMFPARASCYPGWTEEYTGYLAASHPSWKGSADYVCLDSGLEFVFHGSTSDDDHVIRVVEVSCGSLPCPPYVEGREAPCVICTK